VKLGAGGYRLCGDCFLGRELWQHLDRIPVISMTAGHISMLERGQRGYTQETLEAVAAALQTDVASLLIRDPTDPDAIWPIWDRAKPAQRRQLVEIAKTLVSSAN